MHSKGLAIGSPLTTYAKRRCINDIYVMLVYMWVYANSACISWMDEITTQIEIGAAPAVVWDTLTDFAGNAEWNPSMEITGSAEAGERLRVTFTYPNQKPTTVSPTVLVADAPTDFRWQGRLFVPGLYDGEHRSSLRHCGTERGRSSLKLRRSGGYASDSSTVGSGATSKRDSKP